MNTLLLFLFVVNIMVLVKADVLLNFGGKVCPTPNRPPHGNFKIIRSKDRSFGALLREGDSIEYRCNKGYTLYGSKTRNCMKFGFLTGSDVTCGRQVCFLPLMKDHLQTRNGNRIYQGKTAEFFCDHGYSIVGRKSIKCMQSGRFNGRIPRCVKDA